MAQEMDQEMDHGSMASNRPAQQRDLPGSQRDLSREADLLMDDLEIVLRCQCCVAANTSFRVETWESEFVPAQG
jgi:hypothetical protein